MVNATELRIGNAIFIKWSKEIRIVNCLDIRDLAENRDCIQDQAEPIPLTPEILEQWFGFEKTSTIINGTNYIDYRSDRFVLFTLPHEGVEVEFAPFKNRDIEERAYVRTVKYVHEFQNLTFALTGQELQIKQAATI